MYTQIVPMFLLTVCILYINFNCNSILYKLRYDYQMNFGKNRIAAPPSEVFTQKFFECFFLIECILCKKNCAVPLNTSRDIAIRRILEKTRLQRPLVTYKYKNCTIFLSNSLYLVYKFLCDFIK